MLNTTMTTTDAPAIWIGCLGCYNAGRLVGDWFPADGCPTDMPAFEHAGIGLRWPHFAEGHEELWVFDHENFAGLLNGECSPREAQRLAALINAADARSIPRDVLAHWSNDGNPAEDTDEFLDGLQDAYCGCWNSGADYAQDLHTETSDQPDTNAWPFSCIDWVHAWQ